MLLDLMNFIQKYVPFEAIIPMIFLFIGIFYKYVYTPWNIKFNDMHRIVNDILESDAKTLDTIKRQLDEILAAVTKTDVQCTEHHNGCTMYRDEIKKNISTFDAALEKIVERLEHLKDAGKDGKIDLHQQLYAIKQDISDLKSKIEPLLYYSKGIK